MSRVQQGDSQAVKTDSGLLPEFHLHNAVFRNFDQVFLHDFMREMRHICQLRRRRLSVLFTLRLLIDS